jgi:hypothetical protein
VKQLYLMCFNHVVDWNSLAKDETAADVVKREKHENDNSILDAVRENLNDARPCGEVRAFAKESLLRLYETCSTGSDRLIVIRWSRALLYLNVLVQSRVPALQCSCDAGLDVSF